MKRPLLLVASFYVLGILFSRYTSFPPFVLLAVALVFTVAALAWKEARLFLLYTAFFMAGWTNHSLKTAVISPYDARRILGDKPVLAAVRGTLRETPATEVFQ